MNEPMLLLALGMGPLIGIISVLVSSFFSNKKTVDFNARKFKLTREDIEKTAKKLT
jgi:hypothetical protein